MDLADTVRIEVAIQYRTVAQKRHACTSPNTAAGRARDVLDILLAETLGQFDYAAARKAARRVFRERSTHDFPPVFPVPPVWRPELEALAAHLGFPITDAAEIERMFRETIRRIAAAKSGV